MPVLNDGTVVTARRPERPPLTVRAPARPARSALVIPGRKGDKGDPGDAGYEHTQSSPSASWSIALPTGFGRRPNVAVYVGDEQVEADVEATDLNVNIQFPTPTAGSAVIN